MSEYMHNRQMARDWNRRNFAPEAIRLLGEAAKNLESPGPLAPVLAQTIRQFIDDNKEKK